MEKTLKGLVPFCIIFVVFIIVGFNYKLTIRSYDVKSNKLNKNVKLLLITDLHGVIYGDKQSKLVNKIKEINPDAILFAGDMFDEQISYDGTKQLFDGVANEYDCYFVTGNHEYWTKEIDEIKNIVRGYGITILEGNNSILNVRGQNINILGIDDPAGANSKSTNTTNRINWLKQLEECGGEVVEGGYNILLAHRPANIDKYKKYKFDLVLSGHSHGGQVRVPYLINGLYAPDEGCFPKYAGGHYEIDDINLIVSRGLMTAGIIPRIYNPPELVEVNLIPE